MKIDKHEFLVIYKSAWGKISEKKIRAYNLRSVVAKFDRIKPNATIQKIYINHTNTIYEEVYNG